MQNPELFHQAHKKYKQHIGGLIKKYLRNFEWRNDGSDILMDIGSGPGDILANYIYPEMPKQYDKLICTDILQDMLEFSQTHYRLIPKCEYRVLDITMKAEELPADLKGKIHHLTAINLMHWIKDHEKSNALQNMYKLLSSRGGDCLIIFMPYLTLMYANEIMLKSSKWCHYFKAIDEYVPMANYSKDLLSEFRLMLEDVGFSNITIEQSTCFGYYESYDNYKESFKSVCSLQKFIPECRQSEFLDDFVKIMLKKFAQDEALTKGDTEFCCKFNVVVAHAKKLPK